MNAEKIARMFFEDTIALVPLKQGLINDTFICSRRFDTDGGFILQKINTTAFLNPRRVTDNIVAVTEYLSARKFYCESLECIPAANGDFVVFHNGEYWRCYKRIAPAKAFDNTRDNRVIEETGRAFGGFLAALDGFPADSLYETIKDFHNTPKRFDNLLDAVETGINERVTECRGQIEFLLSQREKASSLFQMQTDGVLPIRVTHNDCKINNVLFDAKGEKAIAVVDLDTVMMGLAAYDFGDGARSCCSCAKKDGTQFSLDGFEAFCRGFLSQCKSVLTDSEKSSLALGVYTMTAELAVRFLTDYFSGDEYFQTTEEKGNLLRANSQIGLLKDITAKYDKMNGILGKLL